MLAKYKKAAIGLFVGFFISSLTLAAAIVLPPESLLLHPPLHRSFQASSADYEQVRVIKPAAVLRVKPKEDSVVIKKLPLGALLDVEEDLGAWLKIKLPPDEDDFVLVGYLHRTFTEKASVIHE